MRKRFAGSTVTVTLRLAVTAAATLALTAAMAPGASALPLAEQVFGTSQPPLSTLSSEVVGSSVLDMVASSLIVPPMLSAASSCMFLSPCY